MADNKDYWNKGIDSGNVKISEEVIASIAAIAVSEVEGVKSLSAGIGSDIAGLLGKKNLTKGVKIKFSESSVEIDVFISVKFGSIICDVAKEIQSKVTSAVESMAGMHVTAVNVNVTGISFDEEEKASKEKTDSEEE